MQFWRPVDQGRGIRSRRQNMSPRRHSAARLVLIVAALGAAVAAISRDACAQWVILHGKNGHTEKGVPSETVATLKELAKKGAQFSSISFSPNGGWIILHDQHGMLARHAPRDAVRLLSEEQANDVELNSIAFTFAGGFTALTGNGTLSWEIGQEPFDKLGELLKAKHRIKSIGFAPEGGWIILYDKNSYFAKGIPEDAFNKIVELGKKGADLKSIVFARNGGWVILYNKNSVASKNIPQDAEKALNDLSKRGTAIKAVAFMTGPFVPLSGDDQATRDEVLFRMNRAEVPGLAIALVNDGKLQWSRGYGVLRAKEEAPVTGHTRFQAGSISQAVTALAVLRLVDQKMLALDEPLNARLKSWKIPDSDFAKQKPPTLRQALSNTAGFNVLALPFQTESFPTLLDILEGKAETAAVSVEEAPGSKRIESAGGYCVVQQLLMDVTGKQFPELIDELVFAPAGMKQSTFEQPLPKEWEVDAAVGHFVDQQPLAGRWQNCTPALAARGLWSTPADLARLIVALAEAHQGKPKALIATPQIKALLTRPVDDAGLGFTLTGKDRALALIQKGSNPGYTSYLIAYPATGQGAVIMTNSDTAERVINELLDNLKMEYGWPE
jgi:CubicO group peptidase (beta-lactamase class C family)